MSGPGNSAEVSFAFARSLAESARIDFGQGDKHPYVDAADDELAILRVDGKGTKRDSACGVKGGRFHGRMARPQGDATCSCGSSQKHVRPQVSLDCGRFALPPWLGPVWRPVAGAHAIRFG